MEYRDLRKLYYDGEDVYKKAYSDRFNSDYAAKLDFEISGHQAFFVETKRVIELTKSILRLDKEIALLNVALPGKALEQYSSKCLIDEIVVTNNLEGVHSSRREVGEVLDRLKEQSEKAGKNNRFFGMIIKYLKLLTDEKVSLSTCQDIRDIYDELVLNEVIEENQKNAPDGKLFRKEQTAVHSVTDRVIHKGVTPESKILELMEKALAFLNDGSVDALYRMCIFHYLLEYIHPFYDGNGRLGRFILSYCISEELTPILSFRISEVIKENLKSYYDAFVICNDPRNLGEVTPFLTMMLDMIHKSAAELRDALERKRISMERYESLISSDICPKSKDRPLYQYLIRAALFSDSGISTGELCENLKISGGTLRKKLDEVENQGLLVTNREGNKKLYHINTVALDKILLEK